MKTAGIIVACLVLAGCQIGKREEAAASGALAIEGPFVHENLAIFPVLGAGGDARDYITLDEGLAAGTVIVREEGRAAPAAAQQAEPVQRQVNPPPPPVNPPPPPVNPPPPPANPPPSVETQGEGLAEDSGDEAEVNSLIIENRSDRWLFIQAGDVVAGGKQDRTIGIDLTLAPRSGPQKVDVFCVEHGRWSSTGERSGNFSANTAIVPGNELKMAIQSKESQQEVWNEVAKANAAGAQRIANLPAPQAALDQLQERTATGTLSGLIENDALRKRQDEYVAALLPKLQEAGRIGVVAAIDGRVVAADVYGSPALFRKLSRKLLASYALDAALSRDPAKAAAAPPAPDAARAFLADTEKGRKTGEKTTAGMHRRTSETGDAVLYEYKAAAEPAAGAAGRDDAAQPAPSETLHRSYLRK